MNAPATAAKTGLGTSVPSQDTRPTNDGRSFNREHVRVDRGRGYRRVTESRVEVYDIDLAAWLHMRNLPIAEAFKHGRESIIIFYDPESKLHGLAIEFLNSESARFASAVRQIKKVCLATGNDR